MSVSDSEPSSDVVALYAVGHMLAGFDPSEPGLPVIGAQGAYVPAGDADRLIEKAADNGVLLVRGS